jgi:hypothetical protein
MPGRWVSAPGGAKFAPWAFVRGPDGTLWYAPGAWHDAAGAVVAAPEPQAIAAVEAGDVVNPDGSTSTTGPTLRPPTTPRDAAPSR